MKEVLVRTTILEFLVWNDRNGCFLDVDVLALNQHPFTLYEAKLMFWDVLFRDILLANITYDNILEVNYSEIEEFLEVNSLLDVANAFILELLTTDCKVNVYKKIIDFI